MKGHKFLILSAMGPRRCDFPGWNGSEIDPPAREASEDRFCSPKKGIQSA
jgi:hypothetical protein